MTFSVYLRGSVLADDNSGVVYGPASVDDGAFADCEAAAESVGVAPGHLQNSLYHISSNRVPWSCIFSMWNFSAILCAKHRCVDLSISMFCTYPGALFVGGAQLEEIRYSFLNRHWMSTAIVGIDWREPVWNGRRRQWRWIGTRMCCRHSNGRPTPSTSWDSIGERGAGGRRAGTARHVQVLSVGGGAVVPLASVRPLLRGDLQVAQPHLETLNGCFHFMVIPYVWADVSERIAVFFKETNMPYFPNYHNAPPRIEPQGQLWMKK